MLATMTALSQRADRPLLEFPAALNSQTIVGATFVEVLAVARAAGFLAVEATGTVLDPYLDKPLESGKLLRDAGIHLLAVSPAPDLFGWHEGWSRRMDRLLRPRLELYSALGAAVFVLPFMSEGGTERTTLDALDAVASAAAENDMKVAVESIGHIAKYRMAHEVAGLLRKLGRPDVAVVVDAFHFFRAKQDPAEVEVFAEVPISSLQVSNSNGLPVDKLLGHRDRTYPLDGPFPVIELAKRVLNMAPSTPVVVEVIGEEAASRSHLDSAMTAAAQARELLKAVQE